ncbi:MAG: MATE family efflux transporter [Bacillota bacterium]|nr:MATE family efflux transporter [Bacillota bacterium]
MENSQQITLGTAPVGKLLLKLAIPTITAQIVSVLYNMVDRMFIGHIQDVGATALTGVGVCLPIIVIAASFAALTAAGGAPRASIFMGKNENDTAEKILGNCAAAVTLTGLIITAVFLLWGRDLLWLFGASENTIEYAWDYMSIYSIGTVFVLVSLGLNSFITAQGFTIISMISILIGCVTNIILDPIFIFALGWGVKGSALATVVSQALSAAWVIKFLTGKKTILRIKRKNLKMSPKIYLPCVALGLSPFVMQSTEGLITICFNFSLLKYGGDMAVGAMTILCSIMQLSMLPLTGLAQGAQPIISFNFGAGNYDRVKKAFFVLLKVSIVYGIVIWALSVFTPDLLVSIFTSDTGLREYAAPVLRIYMATSLVFSLQCACQQTFLALGNAKTSLFLAALRKIFLLIPLIFILPMFMDPKDIAVFTAEPVADLLAVIATTTLFFRYFKKTIYNKK